MNLHESGEMYLETILVLSKQKTNVRSIDIAEYMNYSKPSVSRAVSLLKKDNYIKVDEYGFITLTDSGHAVANKIYERHNVLSAVLRMLGVSEETASNDACAIEHVISDESFDAIKKHISDVKSRSEK
jgi:DtxR family Mn-dependent transcriptional regulator